MADLSEWDVIVTMVRTVDGRKETRDFTVRVPAVDRKGALVAGCGIGDAINEGSRYAWKIASDEAVRVQRIDGSGAMVAPAETAISDEEVDRLAKLVAAQVDPSVFNEAVYDGMPPLSRHIVDQMRTDYRAGVRDLLAALVASGYRREVDVLREAAPGLVDRAADAARRMAGDDSASATIMASIVRSAVWQALRCTCSDHSDEGAVYAEDITCPMHGSIPATAQAQPLLADGLGWYDAIADAGTAEFDRLWAELENGPPLPPASDETREHPGGRPTEGAARREADRG